MFKISQSERQEIIKYLSSRPYAEVFKLIALVVGLKPLENGNDKENWKEAKGLDKIPKPVKKEY